MHFSNDPESAKPAVQANAEKAEVLKVNRTLSPLPPKRFGYAEARHLLWRAGFGGSDDQIETLVKWGLEKSVDHLVNTEKIEYQPVALDAFDKEIMRPATAEERNLYRAAAKSQDENSLAQFRIKRQMQEQDDRKQVREMQKWWLTRMIESPKPLEEKLTLFWHGHFATNYRTIQNSYHMFMQNQFFREHAVGNYGDMLFGIIRDPAMIAYLNNNESRKGRPNENLAREIMELFALGLGNYSEDDIKEGARALTGYTFDDDEFVFKKNDHDTGAKTILGSTGKFDGDEFVKLILGNRACSQYICRKLYTFFVADLPPDERVRFDDLDIVPRMIIRELANSFVSSRYELKPVLKKLFMSEHFYSTAFMNEQIKSPVTLLVGAVRSLNVPVRDLSILADALDLMGQEIFFPPSVKGWAGGRTWINTSTIFVRQNIMAFLISGKKPQGYDATADTVQYDPSALLKELAAQNPAALKDPAAVAAHLLKLTTGRAEPTAVAAIAKHSSTPGEEVNNAALINMMLLITAMPEYQLC